MKYTFAVRSFIGEFCLQGMLQMVNLGEWVQKAKAKQGRKVEGESLETMHVLGGGNKGWPLKAKKLYSMWQQERKEENEAEFQMWKAIELNHPAGANLQELTKVNQDEDVLG